MIYFYSNREDGDGVFLETIQSAAGRNRVRAVQSAAHLYSCCAHSADHLLGDSIPQAAGASSEADTEGDPFFDDRSGSVQRQLSDSRGCVRRGLPAFASLQSRGLRIPAGGAVAKQQMAQDLL